MLFAIQILFFLKNPMLLLNLPPHFFLLIQEEAVQVERSSHQWNAKVVRLSVRGMAGSSKVTVSVGGINECSSFEDFPWKQRQSDSQRFVCRKKGVMCVCVWGGGNSLPTRLCKRFCTLLRLENEDRAAPVQK